MIAVPTVSVVIPVFNQAQFIGEALQSVFGQTYADYDTIVVDDGSEDSLDEALRPYRERLNVIRQSHRGAPAALNSGVLASQATYIAWLSADDQFLPEKLVLEVDRFEEEVKSRPTLALVYTDFYSTDAEGRIIRREQPPTYPDRRTWYETLLVTGCLINGSTTLIKRSLLLAVGGFDETLPQSHDYDLWIRLAREYDFAHIAVPLVLYRIHPDSLSRRPDALAYRKRVQEKYRGLST